MYSTVTLADIGVYIIVSICVHSPVSPLFLLPGCKQMIMDSDSAETNQVLAILGEVFFILTLLKRVPLQALNIRFFFFLMERG